MRIVENTPERLVIEFHRSGLFWAIFFALCVGLLGGILGAAAFGPEIGWIVGAGCGLPILLLFLYANTLPLERLVLDAAAGRMSLDVGFGRRRTTHHAPLSDVRGIDIATSDYQEVAFHKLRMLGPDGAPLHVGPYLEAHRDNEETLGIVRDWLARHHGAPETSAT